MNTINTIKKLGLNAKIVINSAKEVLQISVQFDYNGEYTLSHLCTVQTSKKSETER